MVTERFLKIYYMSQCVKYIQYIYFVKLEYIIKTRQLVPKNICYKLFPGDLIIRVNNNCTFIANILFVFDLFP